MIPKASITAWREKAPWITDEQVEQDLILSRVLVELFSDSLLNRELAFRGGTALHKLFLDSPGRYSEDIDLVRTSTGAIGHVIGAIRDRLDVSPFLKEIKDVLLSIISSKRQLHQLL